jgi:hypothetical protein
MNDGAIENFGDADLARKYRNDRVELWLRGFISTDIMEKHLEMR